MTREEELKLLEFEIQKQAEGRKIRSTKVFYDENYWGDFWQKRFNAKADENDPVTKNEVDKKVDFIQKYFPGCKSILDVGCGFGYLTARLHDLGLDSWGVDISPQAIAHAPERVKHRVVPASAMYLLDIFKPGQFELITCFDVLEHLYVEEIHDIMYQISEVAQSNILIRVPMPGFLAEPGVADLGYKGSSRDHVSTYPFDFWVRRLDRLGKFTFWMAQTWNIEPDPVSLYGYGELIEGWLCFRRK